MTAEDDRLDAAADVDGRDPNPWEERARARKAHRIARVLVRLVRDAGLVPGNPLRTVDDYREVPRPLRDRVTEEASRGGVANLGPPSRRTWEMACDLAAEHLRDDALDGPPEPF